jgi:hypothetical protein
MAESMAADTVARSRRTEGTGSISRFARMEMEEPPP